jgi:ethanolamine utilization protein EutN
MILGRVVGEVWSTRKHPSLSGRKLLVVAPYLWYAPSHPSADHLIAVDPVGAGVGEDVVVCFGEPARQALGPGGAGPAPFPVDAAISAIVDRTELADDRGPRPLAFIGAGAPKGALS